MSWVRLDDSFPAHPKVAQLTDREFRVHVRVLCWCAKYKTSGEVLAGAFNDVPGLTRKVASRLIELGLWDEGDPPTVHDFEVYNPKDPTGAKRQADWRKRNAKSNAGRNDESGVTPNGPSRARASADAAPSPSPTPNGSRAAAAAELSEVQTAPSFAANVIELSAAAPQPRATPTDIEARCASLRGADPNTIRVIEPLAMLIPATSFEEAYRKLKRRKNVDDEPALFVALLKAEVKEQARAHAHAALTAPRPEAPEPASKRARNDPKSYLAEKIPELAAEPDTAFDDWLNRFLTTFVTDTEHDTLRDYAHAARNGQRGAA